MARIANMFYFGICLLAIITDIHVEAAFMTHYDVEFMRQDFTVEENIYFKNFTLEIGRISKKKPLTVNFTVELLTIIGHEVSLSMSLDEIQSDGFENLFSLTFDICHSIEKDKFIMPFIRRNSNMPSKCPINPFVFQVTNLPICTKPPFPPMLPEIPFLLTYEYFYTGSRKRFAIMKWYMKVVPFE